MPRHWPGSWSSQRAAEGRIKRIAAELTRRGRGNQVGRAINQFALVAAAGELGNPAKGNRLARGEALRAVRVCLKAWLAERGHLGNHEDAAILAQVRKFVTANQYSRFADWFDTNHRPTNMVGYRKGGIGWRELHCVAPGWAEITKGRDPKRAALLCLEAGYLLTGKDRKRLQRQARLPGMGTKAWVYLLTERVLADEASGPEDDE